MSTAVAVLGGGSFGTAMAHLASFNCDRVTLWARDPDGVLQMQESRENERYLPGFEINSSVRFTNRLDEALDGAQIVLLAVPSQSFRVLAQMVAQRIGADVVMLSGTKGVESGNFRLMSQILDEELPENTNAVVSGPNLAVEIMERKFTGTVIAARCEDTAVHLREIFMSPTFIPYYNPDLLGVQIAGALKNIYALMAGYMHSRNVGFNANATLLTRALAEMMRFGVALGASPTTFLGIAGVGDLVATCTSPLSRNYQLGHMVGNGLSPSDAMSSMKQVAEGVNTLTLVYEKKAELGVRMPIVDGMWEMWHESKSLRRLLAEWKESDLAADIAYHPDAGRD
ncbi:MAG: NAD(P)-dependent glycerol-3-phosphate dehydrogenase [Gammaproteobacteria bacterium AqS3]|nr:NAD(P)-dependent glycerol-3-phosphate dehydrogenase [Gammaproteobacteria bacterium AqS3]